MARKPDFAMALFAARHHAHGIYDNLRFSGYFDAVALYYTDEPKKPWVWHRENRTMYEKLTAPIKGINFWIPGEGELPPPNGKPCFVLQDLDPKGTLFAPWNPKADDGETTAALKGRNDCIVFSPGAGYPVVDERSIVQGDFGFTAVNVGSVERATPIPGRERLDDAADAGRNAHAYYVVCVYGTKVEIERRDWIASRDKPFAPVWTVDIAHYGNFDLAKRRAAASVPQFDAGAAVKVAETGGGQVALSFPAAVGTKGARAYEYEFTAHHVCTNLDIVDFQRRIYSPDFAVAPDPNLAELRVTFSRADLVWDVDTVFDVRAMSCYGGRSAPISGKIYLESPGEREIRLEKEAAAGKNGRKGGK